MFRDNLGNVNVFVAKMFRANAKVVNLFIVYHVREANVCLTLSLILTMLTKYLDLCLLAFENLDIK